MAAPIISKNIMMNSFSNSQLDTNALPQVEKVVFKDLHPDYIKVAVFSTVISLSFILIPIALIVLFAKQVAFNWIAGLVIGLLTSYILLISYFGAKARQYALREHDMLYRSGLFWQKTTAVSFNRIQHIDLSHGPLERKYGIASLKFFTAGGSSVDLKIPGLPQQDAENLRAFILEKTGQESNKASTP